MTEWRLVELDFGQNVAHFGELGIGLEGCSERVRSDTLFSALAIAYARLYGSNELDALFKLFDNNGNPPFRLSSTFIYHYQGECKTYYLPRPKSLPINYPASDMTIVKDFKRLEFLPLSLWTKWYQGVGFEITDQEQLKNKYTDAFKFEMLPKVALDRSTQASNLYHVNFVRYHWQQEKSGLYFLLFLEGKDNKILETRLRGAFNLLGEEGIGGERSGGSGRFKVKKWEKPPREWTDIIYFNKKNDAYSTIAMFWDQNISENLLQGASYELIERGGWIFSPSGQQTRRKMVRMFNEGSVFQKSSTQKSPPMGKLANVTPDEKYVPHQVYRSGITICLPIRINQENL